jgi:hypothetical protein
MCVVYLIQQPQLQSVLDAVASRTGAPKLLAIVVILWVVTWLILGHFRAHLGAPQGFCVKPRQHGQKRYTGRAPPEILRHVAHQLVCDAGPADCDQKRNARSRRAVGDRVMYGLRQALLSDG